MIAVFALAWWLNGRALRREISALEQQLADLRAMSIVDRSALDLALYERSARSYHAALRKAYP